MNTRQFYLAAIERAVRAERKRIKSLLLAERGKWVLRTDGIFGWSDRESAFRGVQAIDEALKAIKPRRKT